MGPWFGVIAGGTAGPLRTKKKLHLAILNRIRSRQDGRNIQI